MSNTLVSKVLASAIDIIRQNDLDPIYEAEYGICGNLLVYYGVREELLSMYSSSDLKIAAAHAQRFVYQLCQEQELHFTEYLYDVLVNRHPPEEAARRWFMIYEDWENRHDYV